MDHHTPQAQKRDEGADAFSVGSLRPLTNPATAKMPAEIMKSVGIFAYGVSCGCKLRSLTSV